MVAYSFQKRFVAHVQAGLGPGPWCPGMKRHTLRAPRLGRQGHARPEQPVHLYTAMRTKHCRLLGKAVARVQIPVRLVWTGATLMLFRRAGAAPRSYVAQQAPLVRELLDAQPGACLEGEAMEAFARTDGFADLNEMITFFEPPAEGESHFDMVLIGWASEGPF